MSGGGLRRRRKLIPELIKRAACSEDGDPVRRELDAKQRGRQRINRGFKIKKVKSKSKKGKK